MKQFLHFFVFFFSSLYVPYLISMDRPASLEIARETSDAQIIQTLKEEAKKCTVPKQISNAYNMVLGQNKIHWIPIFKYSIENNSSGTIRNKLRALAVLLLPRIDTFSDISSITDLLALFEKFPKDKLREEQNQNIVTILSQLKSKIYGINITHILTGPRTSWHTLFAQGFNGLSKADKQSFLTNTASLLCLRIAELNENDLIFLNLFLEQVVSAFGSKSKLNKEFEAIFKSLDTIKKSNARPPIDPARRQSMSSQDDMSDEDDQVFTEEWDTGSSKSESSKSKEETSRKAAAEKARRDKEEAERKAAEAKRQEEEKTRKAEADRKAAEEQAARLRAEKEIAERKAAAEEKAKRDKEEADRKAAEAKRQEEDRVRKDEAERKAAETKRQEEERARKAEAERKAAEEQAARLKAEKEAAERKAAAEEKAKRDKEEADRRAKEETERKAAEAKRQEEDRARKAEAERKAAAEEKAKHDKEESERKAAENKRLAEERARKAEADRKAAEEKAKRDKEETERKAAEEKKVREDAEQKAKEAKRLEEEKIRIKTEQEAETARKAAEEKAKREKEAADRKIKEDADRRAQLEKETAERKANEEREATERRYKVEAEQKAAEEKARRQKEETEHKAKEAKRQEEENARIKAQQEAETARKAAEEKAKREKDAAEAKRLEEEKTKREKDAVETKRLEEEKARAKTQQEAEAARKAAEDERIKKEAVQKAKEENEAAKRKAVAERKARLESERKALTEAKPEEKAMALKKLLESAGASLTQAEKCADTDDKAQHVLEAAHSQNAALGHIAAKVDQIDEKLTGIGNDLGASLANSRLEEAESFYAEKDYKTTLEQLQKVASQDANKQAKQKALARIEELRQEDDEKNMQTLYSQGYSALKNDFANAEKQLGRVARQNRWPQLQAKACHFLADAYFDKSDRTKAAEFYEIAIGIHEAKNSNETRLMYAHAHERLGYIAYNSGDKLQAFRYLHTIYEALIKTNLESSNNDVEAQSPTVDKQISARILALLGIIYAQNNNESMAEKFLKVAMTKFSFDTKKTPLWSLNKSALPYYYPIYVIDENERELFGLTLAYLGRILASKEGYNREGYYYLKNAQMAHYSQEARRIAKQAIEDSSCSVM